MKFLRALGIGILFWIIIFIEISITMIGLGLNDLTTYIIHYIVIIPIAFFCAWLYYKGERESKRTNGFLVGLLFVVVGIILDLIITVPLFIIPAGGNYSTYFSGIYLIAGLIEGIVLVGIWDVWKNHI